MLVPKQYRGDENQDRQAELQAKQRAELQAKLSKPADVDSFITSLNARKKDFKGNEVAIKVIDIYIKNLGAYSGILSSLETEKIDAKKTILGQLKDAYIELFRMREDFLSAASKNDAPKAKKLLNNEIGPQVDKITDLETKLSNPIFTIEKQRNEVNNAALLDSLKNAQLKKLPELEKKEEKRKFTATVSSSTVEQGGDYTISIKDENGKEITSFKDKNNKDVPVMLLITFPNGEVSPPYKGGDLYNEVSPEPGVYKFTAPPDAEYTFEPVSITVTEKKEASSEKQVIKSTPKKIDAGEPKQKYKENRRMQVADTDSLDAKQAEADVNAAKYLENYDSSELNQANRQKLYNAVWFIELVQGQPTAKTTLAALDKLVDEQLGKEKLTRKTADANKLVETALKCVWDSEKSSSLLAGELSYKGKKISKDGVKWWKKDVFSKLVAEIEPAEKKPDAKTNGEQSDASINLRVKSEDAEKTMFPSAPSVNEETEQNKEPAVTYYSTMPAIKKELKQAFRASPDKVRLSDPTVMVQASNELTELLAQRKQEGKQGVTKEEIEAVLSRSTTEKPQPQIKTQSDNARKAGEMLAQNKENEREADKYTKAIEFKLKVRTELKQANDLLKNKDVPLLAKTSPEAEVLTTTVKTLETKLKNDEKFTEAEYKNLHDAYVKYQDVVKNPPTLGTKEGIVISPSISAKSTVQPGSSAANQNVSRNVEVRDPVALERFNSASEDADVLILGKRTGEEIAEGTGYGGAKILDPFSNTSGALKEQTKLLAKELDERFEKLSAGQKETYRAVCTAYQSMESINYARGALKTKIDVASVEKLENAIKDFKASLKGEPVRKPVPKSTQAYAYKDELAEIGAVAWIHDYLSKMDKNGLASECIKAGIPAGEVQDYIGRFVDKIAKSEALQTSYGLAPDKSAVYLASVIKTLGEKAQN